MAKWMVNIIVAIGRSLDGGFLDAEGLLQVVNNVLAAYEMTERFVLRSTLEEERTFARSLREQVDELNKRVSELMERTLTAERKNEYYFGGSKEFRVMGMCSPNFIGMVKVLRTINPDLPLRRSVVISETLAGLVNELGKKGHSAKELSEALGYAIAVGSGGGVGLMDEMDSRQRKLRWRNEFCLRNDNPIAVKHTYDPSTGACSECGEKAYNYLDI